MSRSLLLEGLAVRFLSNFAALSVVLLCLTENTCPGVVLSKDEGTWPEDWPQELEPLRASSRTITVGTAIHEEIHEIPIANEEMLKRIWPSILKLRTPGSPLTLYRPDGPRYRKGAGFLSNERAAIRILAPDQSVSLEEFDNPRDFNEQVADGLALRARAPWPKYLIGPQGELPEYVAPERDADGRPVWVPADPREPNRGAVLMSYNRARIEIELVVDGRIIDLNRLRLPDGAIIVDRRFVDEGDSNR